MGGNNPQIVTFTPLSRQRYRCNQDGEVVKKRQVKNYRALKEGIAMGIRKPVIGKDNGGRPVAPYPNHSFAQIVDGKVTCPYCGDRGWNTPGQKKCHECGKTFFVVK